MKKEHLNQSKYQRGSEWLRWDLHIHTPDSKLGSSFLGVTWDEYINALDKSATANKISVIGITDYMTIDGYEKVYAAYTDTSVPRLASVDLILPNIEFRSLPSTTAAKALNIHILVNPTDPQHIQKIKQALRNLRISYGGQTYGCIRDQLIEFAKAQKNNLDAEAAYKYGVEQFKPSYEEIKKWLQTERWLRENSLIGIANGKDGISGLPFDGFSAVRDELLKNCNFIFTANTNDRLYYLGRKSGVPASEIITMYGSLKPCVHGSDAHNIEKLFKPDDDRYCWIKSNPTFEGLRQILWEPESRVHIGATKPQPTDHSKVIDSLAITNSNGWFTQSQIPLNSGLVAIIGEKGAGKTAIADLIAFGAGIQPDNDSNSSFIRKGRLHLNNLDIKLSWGGGSSSTGTLINKPHSAQRPLVRYLSQDFVERLCSDDHEGNELQQAIEEVVFARLDEVHKEGFSSFAELRKAREAASQNERNSIRGELATLHREIERLYTSLNERPSKVAIKKQIEEQIAELKKQLPTATEAADQVVLKKLEDAQSRKAQIEKEITAKSREKRKLDETLKSYRAIKARIKEDIDNLITPITTSLNESQIIRFYPQWDSQIETELESLISLNNSEIQKLQGSETAQDKLENDTLLAIRALIHDLQESLTKDELNKKRLLDLQKQIASLEATAQRLEKEIEDLDGKVTNTLRQKERQRKEHYLNFFEILAKDEAGLKELYASMKEQLKASDAEMKFELSAGYYIGSKEWLEKSSRFYDGRKSQASAKRDETEKYVADQLIPAWKTGDKQAIDKAFSDFEALIAANDFMQNLASPSLKMVDLFDWMYSTDHIETTYKIQYGGTSLEHLSPGTRGIALLVLYLLMDEDDRRPLVIDQPEGNLDNSSIYQQLVPYIRAAKEKRQIILVTHNPNLVVATDAEQIIIATSERLAAQSYPRISYIYGSLEHNELGENTVGTRQAVCTLLEGGDRAFKDREGRYSIRS